MPTDIQQNLQTVRAVLHKDPKFIEAYPHLFKVIRRISDYLYYFLTYADEKKLIGPKSQQFYASSKYLASRFQYGSYQSWNRNLNVFVTLGLIKRVPPEKVIIKWRRSENLKEVNFYTIPPYTDNLLRRSNRIAKKLLDNNFRMNGFSKNFLIKVFGQKFANNVFPDERAITEYSNYVALEIEKFILWDVDQNGYTTKDRILQGVQINTSDLRWQEYGFHRGSRPNILSREFDRSIKEICDKYDLFYRRANKELKERFGLRSYKNIIYRE
jgi:hypothetical protein